MYDYYYFLDEDITKTWDIIDEDDIIFIIIFSH